MDRIHFNTGRAVRDLLVGVPAEVVFNPVFKGAELPKITAQQLSQFRVSNQTSQDPIKVIIGTLLTAASLDIAVSLKGHKISDDNPTLFTLKDRVNPELLANFLVPRFLRTTSIMADTTLSFASGSTGRTHFDPVLKSLHSVVDATAMEAFSLLGAKLKTGSDTLPAFGEDYQPLLTEVHQNSLREIPTLEQLLQLVSTSTGIFKLGASKNTNFLIHQFTGIFFTHKFSSGEVKRVYLRNCFTLDQSGPEPKVVPKPSFRVVAERSWSEIRPELPIYITGCPVRLGLTYPDNSKEPSLIETVVQKYIQDVRELAA